eukprot:9489166-Pyramimonas_sp.AAC.1
MASLGQLGSGPAHQSGHTYQPGTDPYLHNRRRLITMGILGISSASEGASLRLSSPFRVPILGTGISSRLA